MSHYSMPVVTVADLAEMSDEAVSAMCKNDFVCAGIPMSGYTNRTEILIGLAMAFEQQHAEELEEALHELMAEIADELPHADGSDYVRARAEADASGAADRAAAAWERWILVLKGDAAGESA